MNVFGNLAIVNKKNFFSYVLLLFAVVSVFSFSSCKKYEEENVPNNTAPPDQTIDAVTIENYLNKVYISTLGREPDSLEKSFAVTLLTSNNLSINSRNQFLDSVFVKEEFKDKFYERTRIDLLQGLDTAEITVQIFLIQFVVIPSITGTPDSIFIPTYQMELNRLYELREIPDSLHAGVISYRDVHRRCVDNSFYDEINMGAFNFVVSMFQHFLNRYPTSQEVDGGVNMVNGISSIIFLTAGQSKNDFLDIFFDSRDYYEGQVGALYRLYLFRDPTTIEMNNGTLLYMNSGNYIQLQKSILSLNEYIGI
jgi:hypothetical protein